MKKLFTALLILCSFLSANKSSAQFANQLVVWRSYEDQAAYPYSFSPCTSSICLTPYTYSGMGNTHTFAVNPSAVVTFNVTLNSPSSEFFDVFKSTVDAAYPGNAVVPSSTPGSPLKLVIGKKSDGSYEFFIGL